MSSIRNMGRFCLLGLRSTSKLVSQVTPLARTMPIMHNKLSSRSMASKADSELAEFLKEEIQAEKQNQSKLNDISGFEVKKEGADLTFTKKHGNEKIVVQCNVNHTVDSAQPDDGSEEAPEMRSMPNFEVDIVKADGKTLSFTCSFIVSDPADNQGEEFDDAFSIDEVTMFEGEEWSDKKYAVAGDILDGHLYDLFMGMLDERGINKQFADNLSDFCSSYEHGLYINLLQDLQKFASSK